LITDGSPFPGNTQNPCSTVGETMLNELAELNVDVVVVGIGDTWNPQVLSCLVDNPNKIIEIESFNDLSRLVIFEK
jgi:hypothetical protein